MKELTVEKKLKEKSFANIIKDDGVPNLIRLSDAIQICNKALEMQREELFEKIEKLLDVCTEDDAIKNGCRRCQDYYEIKKTIPQPTFKE